MTAQSLFERWYVRPIEKLKELPDGDGGFAALMLTLPLYERLIVGRLKLDNRPTDEEAVRAEMGSDLHLTDDQQRRFWAVLRIGFMHQAMGQNGRTKWLTSHTFTERPEFRVVRGTPTICLDPWKFADRVLREFQRRPELITASESFPLADIIPMQISELADAPRA